MIACLRDVVGLERAIVHREWHRRIGVAGQVQVDGQVGHLGYGQIHRIAVHRRVRGNCDGWPAAEGQRAAGRRLDRRVLVAERNVSSANRERCGSVHIAKHNANHRTTDTGVHNLT